MVDYHAREKRKGVATYDHAEQTSLISARVILDCLAAQIRSGKLGNRAATLPRRAWGPHSQ